MHVTAYMTVIHMLCACDMSVYNMHVTWVLSWHVCYSNGNMYACYSNGNMYACYSNGNMYACYSNGNMYGVFVSVMSRDCHMHVPYSTPQWKPKFDRVR